MLHPFAGIFKKEQKTDDSHKNNQERRDALRNIGVGLASAFAYAAVAKAAEAERDDVIITEAINEDGKTTKALGEEGGGGSICSVTPDQKIKLPIGYKWITTAMFQEEAGSLQITTVKGEEGIYPCKTIYTTYAVGEEGGGPVLTTQALGEEGDAPLMSESCEETGC